MMQHRPGKRWVWLTLAAVGFVGAGFWAGWATFASAPLPGEAPAAAVTAQVTEQSVGRQLSLNVTVEQRKRPLAANTLTGVITQVRGDGDNVRVGDVLYRVANVPVRAVRGDLPFYRPLTEGDQGADVKQLQDALTALKLPGAVTGRFGANTTRAVKAWQKRLGIPETGSVRLGELVAVPQLPARLLLETDVIVSGAVLSGGEKAVLGAVGEPTFVLALSQQQARLIPESATITVPYQGREWPAVVAASETGENSEVRYRLTAPGGGPVCGAECAVLATGERLSLLSSVAVVPPVKGPAVPVAAITTRADGSAYVKVVDAAGALSERAVAIKGSQGGVAVVSGVTVGETVQVLAASASGAPTPGR